MKCLSFTFIQWPSIPFLKMFQFFKCNKFKYFTYLKWILFKPIISLDYRISILSNDGTDCLSWIFSHARLKFIVILSCLNDPISQLFSPLMQYKHFLSRLFILIHITAQLSCEAITHNYAAVTCSQARRATKRAAQMISWGCTVQPPLTNDLEVMASNNFVFFIGSHHDCQQHYGETRLW